nr:TolC family outer membrane protein [Polymorphobacter sp.]
MTRLTVLAAVVAAVGTTGFAVSAAADTLPDALAAAYETNPQLTVQRAIVRQTDEGVPQALASGRPTVNATGTAQQSANDFNRDGGRYYNGALNLNQSLYRGGRTRTATSAAENRIYAARARLRAVEDNVLLAVVTAYADVLRYAQVVELNENQVKVLQRELQASRDRFEVGDLTRTDVAQSDARLANAQSNLVVAQGQLNTAKNAYLRVVGRPPVALAPLPPLPVLPGTVGQATDLANANNPSLVAARFDEAAARYDVSTIERQRLPTLTAGVGVNYTYTQAGTAGITSTGTGSSGVGTGLAGGGSTGAAAIVGGDFHAFQQTGGLTLTVPLYQAGLNGSQIRAAQAVRSQYMEQIGFIGRQAVETASNAFVSVATARAVITASESSVTANQLALQGVTQENQVGTRTVLEVLNAEQELVVARVNLAAARRDEYVAGYTLLAAVGQAEADPLAVPGEHFDSTENAARVRHKWGDYDIDNDPAPLPLPDPVVASKSLPIGPQR